jgi:hypothetical protein
MHEIQRDDRNEHEYRSDHRVEDELDRRINPPLSSPYSDEEVHRNQHDFPKHIEEEEIERGENAEHAGLEQEA